MKTRLGFATLGVSLLLASLAANQNPAPPPPQDPCGTGVLKPGPGITDPAVLKQIQPKYTSDALRAKIQGIVELDIVVEVNGTVQDAVVRKSLDKTFGLDEEAIKSARQWLFKPGTCGGKPVRVQVVLQQEFRIHGTSMFRRSLAGPEFAQGALDLETPGLVAPRLQRSRSIRDLGPTVPAEAVLDVVILPTGRVDRLRMVVSLDRTTPGLDKQVMDIVRDWTFEPATLDGKPVTVLVTLVIR